MKSAKHVISVQRVSNRPPDETWVRDKLKHLANRALASERGNVWTVRWNGVSLSSEDGRQTLSADMMLTLKAKRERHPDAVANEFGKIAEIVADAGRRFGFIVAKIDGEPTADLAKANAPETYAEVVIPPTWRDNFEHIYERDDQIDIVLSAIKAGQQSDFQNRFHVLLHGEPACGKSEIARTIRKIVGDAGVIEYDATATTQAGAIKDIAERDELPRILIVEEIEKTSEDSLRWMLGVLDQRAEIRKVNFRTSIVREARMLCIATANDYALFQRVMSGALASRFAHHVYCPVPSIEVLRRILIREVSKVDGARESWVEPALAYAVRRGITDPRKVTAICLSGGDELLDGSYQRKLDKTSGADSRDKAR